MKTALIYQASKNIHCVRSLCAQMSSRARTILRSYKDLCKPVL